MPSETKHFDELISDFDKEVFKVDKSVTKDALNNVHGDWYEWLLAIAAWNFCVDNKKANLALMTPNITQFDVSRLYNDKLYDLIKDLRGDNDVFQKSCTSYAPTLAVMPPDGPKIKTKYSK